MKSATTNLNPAEIEERIRRVCCGLQGASILFPTQSIEIAITPGELWPEMGRREWTSDEYRVVTRTLTELFSLHRVDLQPSNPEQAVELVKTVSKVNLHRNNFEVPPLYIVESVI